jgi:hypothetical protein
MAATQGAGVKAAVTRAAKEAAARIAEGVSGLEGEKRYIDTLVREEILSARDVSTLKKVQRRLAERGKTGRVRSSVR